jgi:hypothetical protein
MAIHQGAKISEHFVEGPAPGHELENPLLASSSQILGGSAMDASGHSFVTSNGLSAVVGGC